MEYNKSTKQAIVLKTVQLLFDQIKSLEGVYIIALQQDDLLSHHIQTAAEGVTVVEVIASGNEVGVFA